MTSPRDDLFSNDPKTRIVAAAHYRMTPSSPSYWGDQWPDELAAQVTRWPMHLIGSANAWLVYVAPNPGPAAKPNQQVIQPVEPTLGGRPHPHVADGGFQVRSWTILRKLVKAGFEGVLDGTDALASFMLANVSAGNSARSIVGETYTEADWPRIDRVLRLTRPQLVIAQNREIYDLLCTRTTACGREELAISETARQVKRRRRAVRFEGRDMIIAEAESHFSQGTSWWSEQKYLPLLTSEALIL